MTEVSAMAFDPNTIMFVPDGPLTKAPYTLHEVEPIPFGWGKLHLTDKGNELYGFARDVTEPIVDESREVKANRQALPPIHAFLLAPDELQDSASARGIQKVPARLGVYAIAEYSEKGVSIGVAVDDAPKPLKLGAGEEPEVKPERSAATKHELRQMRVHMAAGAIGEAASAATLGYLRAYNRQNLARGLWTFVGEEALTGAGIVTGEVAFHADARVFTVVLGALGLVFAATMVREVKDRWDARPLQEVQFVETARRMGLRVEHDVYTALADKAPVKPIGRRRGGKPAVNVSSPLL